ncbi:hypothetical protein ASZ90_015252 [hydrocarbon metagenome]|uniref:Uncharacterized protein n=1 Tax=hydrocarbon metagenome TaxID=938273 RepID=A0A0W8F3C5_9ZZZZ
MATAARRTEQEVRLICRYQNLAEVMVEQMSRNPLLWSIPEVLRTRFKRGGEEGSKPGSSKMIWDRPPVSEPFGKNPRRPAGIPAVED